MGKSPKMASAGCFVAMLVLSGCQSSAPPIAAQGVTAQQPWKQPPTSGVYQSNNGGNGGAVSQNGSTAAGNQNGGTGFGQPGVNNANGSQLANNSANVRPQSGQPFGASGNFQNNFGTPQQGGFNQNPGPTNTQPAGFGQNQAGAGIQQVGWQNGPAGSSAANQNGARNLDDNQGSYNGGGISASTPAPVWPKSGSANSNDPPAVVQPDVNYSTKYPTMPFTGGRTGNQ
jgi:hypothetical protein